MNLKEKVRYEGKELRFAPFRMTAPIILAERNSVLACAGETPAPPEKNLSLKRLADAEKDPVIVFMAADGIRGDADADPQGTDGGHVTQLEPGGIFELA